MVADTNSLQELTDYRGLYVLTDDLIDVLQGTSPDSDALLVTDSKFDDLDRVSTDDRRRSQLSLIEEDMEQENRA